MTDGAVGPDRWLRDWALTPDGAPVETASAWLQPVRRADQPAMLRVTKPGADADGADIMEWWAGDGAAPVLARSGPALLLARATGTRSLRQMAQSGQDDAATRLLCDVAARLHADRPDTPSGLIPLERWFRDLWPAAKAHGGVLADSAAAARALLADPRDVRPLHGDLHHDNVLDFGRTRAGGRGWLAIDPNGLMGERSFDFANIFTNPDLSEPEKPVATRPGVFARRLQIVSDRAALDPDRMCRWVLAWAGLSAAWFLQDGDALAEIDLTVARVAAAHLSR